MRVDEFAQGMGLPSERPLASPDAAAIDVELQKRTQTDAQLRLRMGELLDALFVVHGHHELGFSSIDAYAVERAGESARWCQESRAVARRLRERNLRRLRGALTSGTVDWSMAEVLSRYADAASEAALIEAARARTVRTMQRLLAGLPDAGPESGDALDERKTRRRSVTPAELAMLHTSRLLVSYLSNADVSDESFLTALLGEAESNMATWRDRLVASERLADRSAEAKLQGARLALGALRARAEAANRDAAQQMEKALFETVSGRAIEHRAAAGGLADFGPADASPMPSGPFALDRAITDLALERARRVVGTAVLAHRFVSRRLWRRLGFESLRIYVARRPSLCLSTLEHQATLGRHLRRHPRLAQALERGWLGTEAALLIGRVLGRVADETLAMAWIERARSRTYRCLREEVALVFTAIAFDPRASRMPPGLEDLEAAADIERQVQTGALFRSLLGARNPGPQTSLTLSASESPTPETSGPALPMRLWLSDEVYLHWQQIETEFRELAGPERSFIEFMWASLWTTWLPFLEARDDEWAAVYRRDRYRCQNPVCGRRDVTPHHLVFKAHGGGDEIENMVALCSWCHLQGVHRGRLRVDGPVSRAHWRLGRRTLIEVMGRERVS